MKKKTIIILIIAALLLALLAFFMLGKKKAESKISFQTTEITTADISTSITATGKLEAVTTVEVGTQVSGIVNKLYVDYNSVVKKGQVIAVLDRTNLTSELTSAQANLLFYAAAVMLLVGGSLPWPITATVIAIKMAWQIICFSRLTRRFDGGYIHFAAPLIEIYFIIANTILILLPLHSNRKFKK